MKALGRDTDEPHPSRRRKRPAPASGRRSRSSGQGNGINAPGTRREVINGPAGPPAPADPEEQQP